MRRFIRWLRVWEAKAETNRDDSLLFSGSRASSPSASSRTPTLAEDGQRSGESPRKPSLAFPDPVTLLRQADEWFCSTKKRHTDDYRKVRFVLGLQSLLLTSCLYLENPEDRRPTRNRERVKTTAGKIKSSSLLLRNSGSVVAVLDGWRACKAVGSGSWWLAQFSKVWAYWHISGVVPLQWIKALPVCHRMHGVPNLRSRHTHLCVRRRRRWMAS